LEIKNTEYIHFFPQKLPYPIFSHEKTRIQAKAGAAQTSEDHNGITYAWFIILDHRNQSRQTK
jgi:hypothetical protein